MKKSKIIVLAILSSLYLVTLIGCLGIAKHRRIKYLDNHPQLSDDQKSLILQGRLWVGMTEEEVRASLGDPNSIDRDLLRETTDWTYIYRTEYTPNRPFKFEKRLRLEFYESRLADWRKD